jgi:CubicO group peptidase (beta-lactamase class C family)
MCRYKTRLKMILRLSVVVIAGLELTMNAAEAQQVPDAEYSPAVEKRIKAVESSLVGWVQTGDTVKWSLKERMKHYGIKGLSIAVIHHYKLEWAKGYGWADSAENRIVTTSTLFEAASVSKSINAVGLMKLVQDKELDLYADINQYLTSWKFPYDSVSKGKKISTANLLSHTAGLNVADFDSYPPYLPGQPLPDLVEILKGVSPATNPAVRSLIAPGLRFMYSGGGVTITQLLVEDITHQPYASYMYKNVLQPLGMNSTIYQPPPADKKQILATSYFDDGRELEGKYHNFPALAAAGLWTNPTELSKYIIEIQLSVAGMSAKVLNQRNAQLMLTPYVDSTVALGVFIEQRGSRKYFGHEGSDDGFMSQYFGSIEGGDGVVVMMNTANVQMLEEVINSVSLVYHWEGFYQPVIKKVVALSASEFESYTGKYQFVKNKNLYLQISVENGHLVMTTLWDKKQYDFLPESDLQFFSRSARFPLKFTKDENGIATKVNVEQDEWDRVRE